MHATHQVSLPLSRHATPGRYSRVGLAAFVLGSVLGLLVPVLALLVDPSAGLALLAATAGMIAIIWLVRRPLLALYTVIAWLYLEDPILLSLTHVTSGSRYLILATAVAVAQEGVVVIGLLILLLLRDSRLQGKWSAADLCALAVLADLGLYVLLPSQLFGGVDLGLITKATSARSYAIPVLLYLFGRLLNLKEPEYVRLIEFIRRVAILAFVAGVVITLAPNELLIWLGIYDMLVAKVGAITAQFLVSVGPGVPPSYYFQDLTPVWVPWPGIRRLSTTVLDPIATGLLFATVFLICFATPVPRRRLPWILTGTAVLASLSHGAIGIVAVGLAMLRLRRPKFVLFGAAISLGLLLAAYLTILPTTAGIVGTSKRADYLTVGITQAITHPFGRGLGTSGYLTFAREGANPLTTDEGLTQLTYESFVGSLGIQVGLPGILAFMGFSIMVVFQLHRLAMTRASWWRSRTALAMAGAMAGMGLVAVLSSSGFGFAGVGLAYLMAGVASSELPPSSGTGVPSPSDNGLSGYDH